MYVHAKIQNGPMNTISSVRAPYVKRLHGKLVRYHGMAILQMYLARNARSLHLAHPASWFEVCRAIVCTRGACQFPFISPCWIILCSAIIWRGQPPTPPPPQARKHSYTYADDILYSVQ